MHLSSTLFRFLSVATIALLLAVGFGAAVLTSSLSAAGATALQDDDDDDDDGGTVVQTTLSPVPRAVRLHSGDCDARGGVVAELISLRAPGGDDDDDADDVDRIEYGYTPSIPLTIDQMKDSDHAIVIYESDDDSGRAIACANIGGATDDNGSLVIALRALQDSGITGVVVLSPNPANLSATQASIFIIGSPLGDDVGTRDDDDDDDTNAGGAGGTTDDDDGLGDDDDGLGGDDDGVGDDDGAGDDGVAGDDDDGVTGDDDGAAGDDDGGVGDDDAGDGADDDGDDDDGDDDDDGGDDDGDD